MITHVFDTSAILAHYFDEPGAEQVNAMLADTSLEIGLSAISLIELKTRIASKVPDKNEARRAYRLYAEELLAAIPVTREIVASSEAIIQQSACELNLHQVIAAATARSQGAVLVHREANLRSIPSTLVQQHALPI
jgi:predicted nucleic acid-binding protein